MTPRIQRHPGTEFIQKHPEDAALERVPHLDQVGRTTTRRMANRKNEIQFDFQNSSSLRISLRNAPHRFPSARKILS